MSSALNRFEEKYIPEPNSGCWIWTASANQDGYGRFWVTPKRRESAHRYAYELYKSKFEKKLCVLHKCDNPSCVNPDHLFLGTNQDNVTDRVKKGRSVNLRGSSHGRAKLTEQDVREIRSSQLTVRGLARLYAVSPTLISRIRNYRIWRGE